MRTKSRSFPVMGCIASLGTLVIGLVGFGVLIYLAVVTLGSRLTQFAVPGQTEVRFDQPGRYTIYHEQRSTFEGRAYSTEGQISGLAVTVRNAAGGELLPVRAPGMSSTYSLGGREGVAIFVFDVRVPGTYLVSGEYPPGSAGAPAVLAVGSAAVGKMLLFMFGGFAFAGACVLVALLILIVSLVRAQRRGGVATAT
jgi:hypothetical protein